MKRALRFRPLHGLFGGAALRALAVFALLAAPGALCAEPKTLDEAAAEIGKAAANIKAWKGEMEIEAAVMGMNIKQTGPVVQRGAERNATLTMDVAGQKVQMKNVVDKDGTIWIETNAMGTPMVMKMDAKTMGAMGGGSPLSGAMGSGQPGDNPTELLEQMRQMAALEWKGAEESPEGELYVFEGALGPEFLEGMKSAEQMGVKLDLKSVRLKFGKADGFPREFILLDGAGAPLVATRYRKIELNPEIDESLFAYAPPPGAQVQDLLEMAKQMGGGLAADGALGGADAAGATPTKEFNSKLKVGDAAPEFEAKAWKSDAVIGSASLRGKPAVLHFWASWRKASIAQHAELAKLGEDFAAKGVKLVGVSLDRSDAAFEEFMAAHSEIAWPVVYDGKGWNNAVAKLYGVDDIPFLLFIDAEGKVAARAEHVADLRSAMDELLAK